MILGFLTKLNFGNKRKLVMSSRKSINLVELISRICVLYGPSLYQLTFAKVAQPSFNR